MLSKEIRRAQLANRIKTLKERGKATEKLIKSLERELRNI